MFVPRETTAYVGDRPNITGGHYGIEQTNNVSGCFYNGPTSVGSGSADYDNHMIMMDASRSSSAYGASETVQPKSVKLLPCIKF